MKNDEMLKSPHASLTGLGDESKGSDGLGDVGKYIRLV